MNTLAEGDAMKFVLSGRTYDTSTATTVAISSGVRTPKESWEDDFPAISVRFENVLYRTAKGSFFLHAHRTLKFDKGKPVVEDSAQALTPEEAVRWIAATSARIIDSSGLPLPDEA